MPARPDLRQSLGREAVYGDVPVAPTTNRGGRPKGDGPTWEDLHSRVTYHLPNELQQAVAAEATRSGRTKSRVVADALRSYLSDDVEAALGFTRKP